MYIKLHKHKKNSGVMDKLDDYEGKYCNDLKLNEFQEGHV
jgi:hypothetical protein